MKKPSPHRSKKSSAQQTARLGVYLAAGLGVSGSAMSTSEAALITINIGPSGFDIDGVNAGVADGNYRSIYDFPFTGAGSMDVLNGYSRGRIWGLFSLAGDGVGLSFAAGGSPASPFNFSLGASIGSSATWRKGDQSEFQSITSVSPDFGPGSYMGFKTSQGNYGWLEVTWDSASQDFQIFSGAYESTPNVAIPAGAGPAPIPEPGTWAAAALLAGGAAFARWRKRRDGTQKEAA
jgi:hypothetical protein